MLLRSALEVVVIVDAIVVLVVLSLLASEPAGFASWTVLLARRRAAGARGPGG